MKGARMSDADLTATAKAPAFRMEITGVEFVVENEIAQGCNQRQIAQTYALALKSSYKTDWKRVNAAILKRWPKGLERIKKMAWSGKCFAQTTPAEAGGET
jgi:hypothetical protein